MYLDKAQLSAIDSLECCESCFQRFTKLMMTATDSTMDTGERVNGGCEGPDAMYDQLNLEVLIFHSNQC